METLTLLLEAKLLRDELEEAMGYIQRARVLKPLDAELREREATTRIGLARKCALARRWDEGRDQFRAAEELTPDLRQQYFYLARKALFEAKASQRDASERFLREAQALLPEPTPVWLALAAEATRYEFSAATIEHYSALWTASLKKKCQSQTAGEMALVLEGYCRMGVEYQGRSHHIDQLISYLRRTTRLKYRQVDIERVCELLTYLSHKDARKLLGKLTAHGLKLHPRSAQLSLQAGVMALGNSKPPFLDPAAARHLEKALALAEESKLPSETALLPVIRKMLTTIKEMSHMAEALAVWRRPVRRRRL